MNVLTLCCMVLLAGVLLLCARSLGLYIAHVMQGQPGQSAPGATSPLAIKPLAIKLGAPLEAALYRAAGIDPRVDMNWQQYALAVLQFSVVGVLLVYAVLRLQGWLPLNPQHVSGVSADTAFNTAISFVTNTNWQSYAGEAALSYLAQMSALAVQNFVSAATGIAVAMAVMRGFIQHRASTLGNFWVDLVRATLYVLLPLSIVLAVLLAVNGVIQNFSPYQAITTLDGQHTQWLPMGPVASQEAIKELGTNGGGFFNANSSHPFENPTPFTNVLQILAILLIPVALTFTFGQLVGDRRQGWTVLAAMTVLLCAPMTLAIVSEQTGNSSLTALGVDQSASSTQGGGNMEGKETRFGALQSAVFASVTTGTSTGAVNSMHDSFTALGGLAPLALMQLGEVAPGGVGSGLYGMVLFALLAVFIAGLMIGRTPEYLGKKIESFDIKMMSLAILVTPLVVLIGTAMATATEAGRAGVGNPGAHGFSEILYAFSSAGNNNGSAFGGLTVNTPFYNTTLGIAMWLGRFWIIIPILAMAGSLAGKQRIPASSGTMPTHGPLFIALLIGVVLLVGLLTYVPALALGPIAEHLLLTLH